MKKSVCPSNNQTIISVGLCEGRHEIPGITGYVFPTIEDPSDFVGMSNVCAKWIGENCNVHLVANGLGLNAAEGGAVYASDVRVNLYVTGLTAACAAFIRVCAVNGVGLSLMHFNPKTGEYAEQYMF